MGYYSLEARDRCREHLTKYLFRALEFVPQLKDPLILDLGCGTGVPTLALARHFDGIIHAVDSDKRSIQYLGAKLEKQGLTHRVKLHNASVLEANLPSNSFDLILAEGLLNVIGFEEGIRLADHLIKTGGYFIIHDELPGKEKKMALFNEMGYSLEGCFELSQDNWWNEFYECLISEINKGKKEPDWQLEFKGELEEIEMVRKDRSLIGSVYYILKK